MIVGTLKNNIQASIGLMLILSIGAWLGTFGFAETVTSVINHKEHILYSFIFESNYLPIIKQIITLITILVGAVMINYLTIEQEISSKTNYLPAFLYLLFSFSVTNKHAVEPILTANIFILIALHYLMNSYRKEHALSDFFKAGLFFGLATFFCIHYMIIFPLSFVALIILRAFNWREWMAVLIGLLTPLYFYVGINYLTTNNPFVVFLMIQEATASIQLPIVSEYYFEFILITILSGVFAIIHYLNKGFGGKVKTQKTKYIILWMLFLCLFMLFFEQMSDMILLPCIIPLSIIIGDYLSAIKQLKIANTLLFLLLCGFFIIYLHSLGIF